MCSVCLFIELISFLMFFIFGWSWGEVDGVLLAIGFYGGFLVVFHLVVF